MSYVTDTEKLIFLNKNYVILNDHTWTTSFTTVSGAGPDHLSDDDATSLCKSSGSLTTPWIQITFTSPQSITAMGVCNHNFRSSGLTYFYVEYDSTGLGDWVNVDTPGTGTVSLYHWMDNDVARIFGGASKEKWRIRFAETPTQNIQVGMIWFGTYVIFDRNPSSFIQRRKSGTKYIQTSGGGIHASLGPAYRQGELEIGWKYASDEDLLRVNGWALTRNDNISCFVPPEASYNLGYSCEQQPFFGRIDEVEIKPIQGNTVDSSVVYDLFVSMKGAV